MRRRTFLEALGLSAAGVAATKPTKAAASRAYFLPKEEAALPIICNDPEAPFDIEVDPQRMELTVISHPQAHFIHVQSVYSRLKDMWKERSDLEVHIFPIMAITPQYMRLVHGWRVTNPHALYGALDDEERGKTYRTFRSMGTVPVDAAFQIRDLSSGRVVHDWGYCGHVAGMIEVKPFWQNSPLRIEYETQDFYDQADTEGLGGWDLGWDITHFPCFPKPSRRS